MKRLACFITLLFVALLCHAADPIAKVLPENYGEVIFVRQESMGKLNIVPARITCDQWERLAISGGQASAIFLAEGDYEFQAFSQEPYDDSSDRYSCRSTALKVKIRKGKKVFIEVIAGPSDEKTPFGWALKKNEG